MPTSLYCHASRQPFTQAIAAGMYVYYLYMSIHIKRCIYIYVYTHVTYIYIHSAKVLCTRNVTQREGLRHTHVRSCLENDESASCLHTRHTHTHTQSATPRATQQRHRGQYNTRTHTTHTSTHTHTRTHTYTNHTHKTCDTSREEGCQAMRARGRV